MGLGGAWLCPHLPTSLSPPPCFWQGLQRRATPHPSELKSMKKGMEVRRSEASAAARRDSGNTEVGIEGFCQRSGGLSKEMPARSALLHVHLDLLTSLVSWRRGQRRQPLGLALRFRGAVLNWPFREQSGDLNDWPCGRGRGCRPAEDHVHIGDGGGEVLVLQLQVSLPAPPNLFSPDPESSRVVWEECPPPFPGSAA